VPIPPITGYPMPSARDLPRGQVSWSLDADRAVLLIHDMQAYFIDFFPPGQPRAALLEHVGRLRQAAADRGVPVVFTAQPGGMSRADRGLLHDFWGPGMSPDPAHRRIVDELAPAAQDTLLTKWRYSAFVRSPLERLIRDAGRDQLVVCGVYAHVGVLMTACDAFTRDIQPFLVADAVADFTWEDHRLALDYAARRCATVLTTDQVVRSLSGRRKGQPWPGGRSVAAT
jgi:isochorismate hydrolase